MRWEAPEGGRCAEVHANWRSGAAQVSKGKKRYNTGNRAGYFCANCNLDPLELEYWRDFRTHGTPHKGLHYALFKILKSSFLSQPQ